MTPEQQAWFKAERGIHKRTLDRFGVEGRADGAVLFDYGTYKKARYGIPDGERSFKIEKHPKMPMQLYGLQQLPEGGCRGIVVCEGETDTMRFWQELHTHGITDFGVVGMPGTQAWQPHMATTLDVAEKVYVILDNDDYNSPGRKQSDQAWRKIRAHIGPKCRRVLLDESGCKDLCEFFERFSLEDMGSLFRREPEWNFAALNLRDLHLPRETTWLIDGLLARGDVMMLTGDSGVGKSFLSLDLAVAVILGRPWCGRPVVSHLGRVLYIDEENPEQLIYQRLRRLGLPDELAIDNMRYVCQQGVNLERDFDGLVEDAQRFGPDLLILDTLVQLHDGEEVDNRAMTKLFSRTIRPLARETGASVCALHHTNKPREDGKGTAAGRVRGGTSIRASVDSAVEAREDGGTIVLEHFKSRRTIPLRRMRVTICDLPEGRIEVAPL